MNRKILVAYDGSEMGDKAVQEAKRQVSYVPDTEVHIISVAETTGPATDVMMTNDITNEVVDNAHKQLNGLKETFEETETEVVTHVIVAKRNENPGKYICEYAKNNEINMIIVGSRGLGNVKSLFLGSVSNNIVQHAAVPVLVMK